MAVHVKIPTQLRSATDGESLADVDGATVGEVLDALNERYGELRSRIAEDGGLRRFVNVYVDGEDIRFLDGLDTEVVKTATRSRSRRPSPAADSRPRAHVTPARRAPHWRGGSSRSRFAGRARSSSGRCRAAGQSQIGSDHVRSAGTGSAVRTPTANRRRPQITLKVLRLLEPFVLDPEHVRWAEPRARRRRGDARVDGACRAW